MPMATVEEQREYQRKRVAKCRATWLSENGPCAQCGSCIRLEVDHIDPSTKTSHNVWSWSLVRRLAELSKCQILCHECHKKKTSQQLSFPLMHGTELAYTGKRCRCRLCKDAHAKHKREYRARIKASHTTSKSVLAPSQ